MGNARATRRGPRRPQDLDGAHRVGQQDEREDEDQEEDSVLLAVAVVSMAIAAAVDLAREAARSRAYPV
ncbi:hypothetical protein GS966_13640 [Rhodococcus hoagii]|nr:hypothetical protein [Prescottella equi]NKZ90971.1 hypothetical protein [Prescottella equi]